jgi:uncharacterized spore protein YtfJ
MIDTKTSPIAFAESNREQLLGVMGRICSAAQPGAVYGQPVVSGNYTVITASEVSSGGGFGYGSSFGPAATTSTRKVSDEQAVQAQAQQPNNGGGVGGGGGASGRPVAIIVIGPDGVTVKPVFDITKIALTGISAWQVMLAILSKMRKAGRR